MTDPWQPLLAGDLAARALEAVHAIADALPDPTFPAAGGEVQPAAGAWQSVVATGHAGQALFYGYLALHGGEERHSDAALERLGRAVEGLAAVPMSESLFTGFPGIAWVAEHLEGRLFAAEEDGNAEVDEALLPALAQSPWRGEYDLIFGLAGLGVYALERLPRPSAASCLEQVVARLAERAERVPQGIAWFSPPESVPEFQREMYPRGLYNLGTAHGIPGVVPLLAAACRAGVAADLARPLLADAMAWLLARRVAPEQGYRFPHMFHPDAQPYPSRIAWCYGDVGVAAALLAAARAAGEPEWERAAVAAALCAAERPPERSAVLDAGLCHGAAGVAHLFNRMYQTTGEPRLGAAARDWFARALDYRQPGAGIAGFRAWTVGDKEKEGGSWREDPGFLEGTAGIGLALLAAVSPVAPDWDRLLLASLAP
jgi:class I lanthipeptide synthase